MSDKEFAGEPFFSTAIKLSYFRMFILFVEISSLPIYVPAWKCRGKQNFLYHFYLSPK
jgi:hypothetical protein